MQRPSIRQSSNIRTRFLCLCKISCTTCTAITADNIKKPSSAVKLKLTVHLETWTLDQTFLTNKNYAINVSKIGSVKYVSGQATQDSAPNSIYGTATAMNATNDPKE